MVVVEHNIDKKYAIKTWMSISVRTLILERNSEYCFSDLMSFYLTPTGMPSTSKGPTHRPDAHASTEGWIGHPLDPIGCLFDTLTEASIINEENTTQTQGKPNKEH